MHVELQMDLALYRRALKAETIRAKYETLAMKEAEQLEQA